MPDGVCLSIVFPLPDPNGICAVVPTMKFLGGEFLIKQVSISGDLPWR